MELTGSSSNNPLSSIPNPKRTRRRTEKSRQGCARCKTRRVKCDEQRPSCGNCVKISSKCPGYQQQLRWSNKYERLRNTTKGASPDQRHINPSSPKSGLNVEVDTEEQRAGPPDQLDLSNNTLDPLFLEDFDFQTGIGDGTWDPIEDAGAVPLLGPHGNTFSTPVPQIPQSLVHLPTTLIEYWFRSICPMRSTFDSEINYNRQVSRNSWATSESVFNTMQVMSAACLVDSMPQLNELLPYLKMQAISAINRGVFQIRSSLMASVTVDLVFAVFALGTSLHWMTPALSEEPWLESAHELLLTWSSTISETEMGLHAYFSQALTYWEMLLAAVGRGSIAARIDRKRQKLQERLRQAMFLPQSNGEEEYDELNSSSLEQNIPGTRPNSWCGISNEVIDTFGRVLALCRSVCLHNRSKDGSTVSMASNALCDISLAHQLQRELLSMDFATLITLQESQGYPVQTQDDSTPVSDLMLTAEAYRQAALLQLHLTFEDLSTVPQERRGQSAFVNDLSLDTTNGVTQSQFPHAEHVLGLTLDLVNTLEKIPAESGSRSIHPMLYLSAAAGLKFPLERNTQLFFEPSNGINEVINPGGGTTLTQPIAQLSDHLQDISNSMLDVANNHQPHVPDLAYNIPNAFISQSILDISKARRLVWSRLSNLQQILPHRASDNMLQLVKAIWKELDRARLDTNYKPAHWLDVLRETGPGMMLW